MKRKYSGPAWIPILLIGALSLAGACGSEGGQVPSDAGHPEAGPPDGGLNRDPPASPASGPSNGPDLSYTFEHETEGWVLNDWADPDLTNLGAGVPDGGLPPTLRFSTVDGDPNAGALELTVGFSGTDQTVIAEVALDPHGLNLSGKTLHARVRRVSGSFVGGVVFYASSIGPFGDIYTEAPTLDAASFAAGAWVPLTLDLSTATEVSFDSKAIVKIGVQVLSSAASGDGGASDGGSFVSSGDAVFEIDTVTD